ncbi:MAG: LPS export ABC transporter permease LptG [Gammaproteobacteria bacterium RIFCSPHIGHO2_12_FULL_38_14]|nr:MAG: LPS export ABC transporter permease LptG [Gammaproteobacteria bacterium RIFCSPHIGHO2_12_FULL_38_14]
MIKVLERYIAKTLFLSTAFVTLVVTGVLFLMMLLTELKSMGEGDYGILQALSYVLMRLPSELYQFSPVLILLGSIASLSVLSAHRELTVMRISGCSIRRIVYTILSAAGLLIILVGVIGEGFAPRLSYQAEVRKENVQHAGQAMVTASGVWFHLNNNFIYVKRIVDRQLLEGVVRYQFNAAHQLKAAYYAKTLTTKNHRTWEMNDVVKTTFYNNHTTNESFHSLNWNLKLNPNLLNIGLIDANDMSLLKLSKFVTYLRQNGLRASDYQYVFWQRIFKPLTSLIMAFLAVSFVFSIFTNMPFGFRILLGVLLGFLFFILNAMIGELCIVFQFPPIFAAFSPLFVFVLFGMFFSKRLVHF